METPSKFPLPAPFASASPFTSQSLSEADLARKLLQERQNRFKFFYYDTNGWNPFTVSDSRKLSVALLSGCPTGHFEKSDPHVVEFKAYFQKNINSGYRRSVGWTDTVTNLNYGPADPFHGDCAAADEAERVARAARLACFLSPLDFNETEAQHVIQMLKKGLNEPEKYTVERIQKMHNTERRLSVFRDTAEEVASKRGGNANIRWAWYGASLEALEAIVMFGFDQVSKPKDGKLYGSGFYFSPENKVDASLPDALIDDLTGERNLLLCQVVLGAQEVVVPSSSLSPEMLAPSCVSYDTGVDYLADPKVYCVWSFYGNTHTIVEYVVTLKDLTWNAP